MIDPPVRRPAASAHDVAQPIVAAPLYCDNPVDGVPVVIGIVVPEAADNVQRRMNAAAAAAQGRSHEFTASELILRGSETRGRRSFTVCPTRLMGAFWFLMAWAAWEYGFTEWWQPAGALETAWFAPSLCALPVASTATTSALSICGGSAQHFDIPADTPGLATRPGSNVTLVVFRRVANALTLSLSLRDANGALLMETDALSLEAEQKGDMLRAPEQLQGSDASIGRRMAAAQPPRRPPPRRLIARRPHGHTGVGSHLAAPSSAHRPLAALPPYSYAQSTALRSYGYHTRMAIAAGTFVWLAPSGSGHGLRVASTGCGSDGSGDASRTTRCSLRVMDPLARDVIVGATFAVPERGLAFPLRLTVLRLEVRLAVRRRDTTADEEEEEEEAQAYGAFVAFYSADGAAEESSRRTQAVRRRVLWLAVFVAVYDALRMLRLGGMDDESCGGFMAHFVFCFGLTIAVYRMLESALNL